MIYLAGERGFDHLRQLHERLNEDDLAFPERYSYHPHITLVQNLDEREAVRVAAEASARADPPPRAVLHALALA